MGFDNFFQFYLQMEPLLSDETSARTAEGFALLEEAAKQFPDERSELTFYRLRLTAQRGDVEGSAAILNSALDQGLCYPQEGIARVLGTFVTAPEMQPVLQRNAAQFQEFVRITKSHVLIMEPEPAVAKPPLLIGLHGNGNRAEWDAEKYRYATTKGWLLAMPESIVRAFENRPIWTGEEMVREQVQRFYADLAQQHPFDESRIVVAGISAGGKAAVDVTLTGVIPARGFIALAANGRHFPPNRERLIPLIDASRERGQRAYVIVGDQDAMCYKETVELAELFKERNLPCELEVHAGLDHDFPPNFEHSLDRAFSFILQSS
jgi:dienelactone hydrolase